MRERRMHRAQTMRAEGDVRGLGGRRVAGRALRALSTVLCLALGAAAWAQPPAIRRVEFDDAIRTALERNPSIATANVAIAEANDLLALSKSTVRPTVNASINNVTLDARRGFSGGTTQ